MTVSQMKTIDLEEGWNFMQTGITKLRDILEGQAETQFSSEEYMMLYTYPFSLFQGIVTFNLLISFSWFLPLGFIIENICISGYMCRNIY